MRSKPSERAKVIISSESCIVRNESVVFANDFSGFGLGFGWMVCYRLSLTINRILWKVLGKQRRCFWRRSGFV